MMIPESQQVWFALDTGTVRCGLAVAAAGSILAMPLAVVETEPRATLGKRIRTALGPRRPLGLVVGLPLDERGEEGPAAQKAREIGELVAAELGCAAHYVDERYTTAEMHVRRREAGIKGKKRIKDIDAWAAVAILQSFLDQQSNK
jgi:putative Holliday junction resolvase